MKASSRTDTGRIRANNEDCLKVDAECGLFLLADGMGGHNAGEVASEIAVNEAYAYVMQETDEAEDVAAIPGALEGALLRAHNTIKEKAGSDIMLYGMGTTLVELMIKDKKAYVCHVGDSRAYLYRGTLQRITKDHTVGDAWVEQGIMKQDQVPARKRHMLTQCLGYGNAPVPDSVSVSLKIGDILLLCSDGLTDMLSDQEIGRIIRNGVEDIEATAGSLVEEANNNGGRDNISVVIVKY